MSFLYNSRLEVEYLRLAIQSPIYKLVKITPLQKMKQISKEFQNKIFAKREDLQLIHSFKLRGAYNMISSLSKNKEIKGIITASAGNHAQGVALSADKIKKPALIVMPVRTAKIKVEAVKRLKAQVLLYGENFDESKEKAIEIANKKKYDYIPPFDHPDVITGQATIAIELLKQNPLINRIFVPVGGGGLISGIAILIKQLVPNIKIIAVESKESACLNEALKSGRPVNLSIVGSFAEGVAVKRIGDENFHICKKYIDDIIIVDTDDICLAIQDLFEEMRVIAEPAGALSLAGLKEYVKKHNIQGENLVHILSGSNINFHSLKYISNRSEIIKSETVFFAIKIPEKKGSLLEFCKTILNYNIIELSYRYQSKNLKYTYIFIGIKATNELENCVKIISDLKKVGYEILILSREKMNKLSFVNMIYGKKIKKSNEFLLNIIIPEYPGSLFKFLKKLDTRWNITLICYKSESYNCANILISIEKNDNNFDFKKYIKSIGYRYGEEFDFFSRGFFNLN